MQPTRLAANTFPSFYAGAGRIGRFRADAAVPAQHPEDWVASTVTRAGHDRLGRSVLPDGTDLADAIAADPVGWLGAEHIARYGTSTGLLTKLLDAGQRLPLHIHPTREFARDQLGSPFGKSEAWIIVHADDDAVVHLGFSRDIAAGELTRWVTAQDTAALLDATNKVPVSSGDVLYCPGGVPHAVGAGILMVEVQEPTDFSVMLEWDGFPLDPDAAFLGLDIDVAMTAVHRTAIGPAELDALRGQRLQPLSDAGHGVRSLLPGAADEFFAALQVVADGPVELDQRLSVLVAVAGSGTLTSDHAPALDIAAGGTYLVPHAAGATTLSGALSVIRCHAG